MASYPYGISVIIPTLNRPEMLDIALKSLTVQIYTNFQVIVVNDAGCDVGELIKKFSQHLHITYVRHEQRLGLSAARNTGIQHAKGKYLVYLDDDDFFYDTHLEVLYTTAEENNFSAVYTNAIQSTFEEKNQAYQLLRRHIFTSSDFSHNTLASKNILPVMSMLHQHNLLQYTRTHAPYLRSHEDWDLWQRLARFTPFHKIDTITSEFTVRIGASSLSENLPVMQETWAFCRTQGALLSQLMPTYLLLKKAASAMVSSPTSQAYTISIITHLVPETKYYRAQLSALANTPGIQLILVSLMPKAQSTALYNLLAQSCSTPPLLIEPGMDIGTVIANNTGAAHATGEWLLFLESDVTISPEHVQQLVAAAHASQSPCGAITPRIVSEYGSLYGGKTMASGEPGYIRNKPQNTWSSTELVSSHCMLIKNDLFKTFQGFDIAYAPNAYADADLCQRLLQQGYHNYLCSDAVAQWHTSSTSLSSTAATQVARRTYWDTWHYGKFVTTSYLRPAEWGLRALQRTSGGSIPTGLEEYVQQESAMTFSQEHAERHKRPC